MANINTKIINNFFDKIEKKVVKTQSKMASTALDSLFRKSPHAGQNQATGEYDANHKISINNMGHSGHHGSTHSEAASKIFLTAEKLKLAQLKFGDSVTILNDTAHAVDVEIGKNQPGNRWRKSGYYPFRKAKADLKRKYKNVIR